MEKANELAETLKGALKENILEIKISSERRMFVSIKNNSLKQAIAYIVKDLNIKHLSTITGSDMGKEIELIYHFAYKSSIVLSLKLTIPKDNSQIATITDMVPSAVLYEREIHDFLGVNFVGHPDLSPLLLPEGWPQGVYPLRKENTFEELRKIGEKQ